MNSSTSGGNWAGGGGFVDPHIGGGREPARGAGGMRTAVTWLFALVMVAVVVWMQRPEALNEEELEKLEAGLTIPAPDITQRMFAKMVFGGKAVGWTNYTASSSSRMDFGQMFQASLDQTVGWTPKDPEDPLKIPELGPEIEVEKRAKYAAADKLRVAIMAGETLGYEALDNRLKAMEAELAPESELHADAALVRRLYQADVGSGKESEAKSVAVEGVGSDEPQAGAAPGAPEATPGVSAAEAAGVTEDERSALRSRHGVFADVALSRGDETSAVRQELASDGFAMFMVLGAFGGLICIVLLAGFGLLITGIVLALSGKLRFKLARQVYGEEQASAIEAEGARGRSPYDILFVETLGVFVLAFLLMKTVSEKLIGPAPWSDDAKLLVTLGMQWMILPLIFWPVLRGMPRDEWRRYVGWTAPKGLMREVGAGILGYIALLFVYVCSAVVLLVIYWIVSEAIFDTPPPQPDANRLTDIFSSGSVVVMLMFATLATVWAPVVEETIFRGSLFRYWRPRAGFVLAGLGSAAIFAAMHGYMLIQVVMVGILGFGFAVLREWRGSSVGNIAAHALHNGAIMILLSVLVGVAG